MKKHCLDNPGWTAGSITSSFEEALQDQLKWWEIYRRERFMTKQLPLINKGWPRIDNSGNGKIEQLVSSKTIAVFESKHAVEWDWD